MAVILLFCHAAVHTVRAFQGLFVFKFDIGLVEWLEGIDILACCLYEITSAKIWNSDHLLGTRNLYRDTCLLTTTT